MDRKNGFCILVTGDLYLQQNYLVAETFYPSMIG